MTFITRFAPSPTGPLHLGHAFSAMLAHDLAQACNGAFLLRIEDIDHTRSRRSWEEQIYADLTWLGLSWASPVMRQSERRAEYETGLDALWDMGLLFRCDCTRRDIAAAASAPQEGATTPLGPDGLIYPGTCRDKPRPPQRPQGAVLRLNMQLAMQQIGNTIEFADFRSGTRLSRTPEQMIVGIGDVVLSRKDFPGSYHLSVVLDDAAQGITHVVRGADLMDATPIHLLLQHLLSLPQPRYHHHRLIRDAEGKRLAKRDDARAISSYRAQGLSPQDIRAKVGL